MYKNEKQEQNFGDKKSYFYKNKKVAKTDKIIKQN